MLYLLEYIIIFIYRYIATVTKIESKTLQALSFYEEYLQTTIETLINKQKTSELLKIPEFCFITSLYSYGLIFFYLLIWNTMYMLIYYI